MWSLPLHSVESVRAQDARANQPSVWGERVIDVAQTLPLTELSQLLEVLVEEPLGVGGGPKASFLVPCHHDTRAHTGRRHGCRVRCLPRQHENVFFSSKL